VRCTTGPKFTVIMLLLYNGSAVSQSHGVAYLEYVKGGGPGGPPEADAFFCYRMPKF